MTDLKNLIIVTFPDSGVSVLLCIVFFPFYFYFYFLFFYFYFSGCGSTVEQYAGLTFSICCHWDFGEKS